MFNFNWSLFNPRMGLIFMVGYLVVFNLPVAADYSPLVGGISALLAWLTVILVPDALRKAHLEGLVIYLIGGMALSWLAVELAPYTYVRLFSMGVVTFVGYLCLIRGAHTFMVGWCLVYWYLLAPLFIDDGGLVPLLISHVMGSGLVLGLNLLKPVWQRATKSTTEEPGAAQPTVDSAEADEAEADDGPGLGFVISYASVVSLTIMAGLAAGLRWLTTDPTLIANATLNMISPTLKQTWHMAVERLVLGTTGIIGGFYFGWFFPDPWVGQLVAVGFAFLTVALVYVNFGLVIGVLFFLLSYSWGTMQSEAAHQIGNEKLFGEFIGVGLAIVAIAILTWLNGIWTQVRTRSSTT